MEIKTLESSVGDEFSIRDFGEKHRPNGHGPTRLTCFRGNIFYIVTSPTERSQRRVEIIGYTCRQRLCEIIVETNYFVRDLRHLPTEDNPYCNKHRK